MRRPFHAPLARVQETVAAQQETLKRLQRAGAQQRKKGEQVYPFAFDSAVASRRTVQAETYELRNSRRHTFCA